MGGEGEGDGEAEQMDSSRGVHWGLEFTSLTPTWLYKNLNQDFPRFTSLIRFRLDIRQWTSGIQMSLLIVPWFNMLLSTDILFDRMTFLNLVTCTLGEAWCLPYINK